VDECKPLLLGASIADFEAALDEVIAADLG